MGLSLSDTFLTSTNCQVSKVPDNNKHICVFKNTCISRVIEQTKCYPDIVYRENLDIPPKGRIQSGILHLGSESDPAKYLHRP